MAFTPRLMHDSDDDSAPIDYTCVSSVSEGLRLRQEKTIHPESEPRPATVVRHRAAPDHGATVDGYGTHARRTVAGTVMKDLPDAARGPAPARSIAYPEDYGIPDDPFSPPPETQIPVRRTRAQRAESKPLPQTAAVVGTGARIAVPAEKPVITTADGSQFEPPVRPDVPDWLRVAQQNNMPLNRPQGPRVQAAPRAVQDAPAPTDLLGRPLRNRASAQAAQNAVQRAAGTLPRSVREYEQAGYPPELLMQQQALEREQAAQPVRRRHGAQYAVNEHNQREYERTTHTPPNRSSYPPARERKPQVAPPNPQPMGPLTPENGGSRAQTYAAMQAETPYTHPVRTRAQAPEEPYDDWQVEADDEPDRPRLNIPWLGIAAFAAAALAVILWLVQMNLTDQTERLLTAREAQQAAILEKHPLHYRELIEEKAQKYNLSPAFVAAIMLNESSFRPDATSSVDARGLMQLMDDTAGWIHRKMDSNAPYDFDNMYDAQTNAEYGCWYLNFLSGRFRGDPVLVAAAFHAGQGEVQNWLNDSRYSTDGQTILLENMIDGPTKKYATRVLNDYAAYKRLYYETTEDDQ